jgi:hypothetical protein
MPSSTSSSSPTPAPEPRLQPSQPVTPHITERPVPKLRMGVAMLTAVIVFTLAMTGWELYWRAYGSVPGYRNSEGLWAIQRRRINQGEGRSTVLIGSSRTLSNIQLQVWERLDGKRPIQLALEGTSPLRALEQLADDPEFQGRLIMGISPGLFFTGFQFRGEVYDYYPRETPSQRWGQRLSMALLEPYFAYYDPDFALFTVAKRQPWPQRQGVESKLEVRKLFVSEADRNMRMWRKVEEDVAYQDLAKRIWAQNFKPPTEKQRAEGPKMIAEQIDRAVAAITKLKARGVEVILVLHPVDGEFRKFELSAMHRSFTWDPLLQKAGVVGIHFEDYPELQGLNLPEWSHLSSADAEIYTERLYRIIESKRAEVVIQPER